MFRPWFFCDGFCYLSTRPSLILYYFLIAFLFVLMLPTQPLRRTFLSPLYYPPYSQCFPWVLASNALLCTRLRLASSATLILVRVFTRRGLFPLPLELAWETIIIAHHDLHPGPQYCDDLINKCVRHLYSMCFCELAILSELAYSPQCGPAKTIPAIREHCRW